MATPKGAEHRDLEQRFRNLERIVRDLVAASLSRRQLSVTEGDFVVSGGGSVRVQDGGGVRVMFPEATAGDTDSTAVSLGDLIFADTWEYAGTGMFVTDIDNHVILNACTGPDSLASSAEVTFGGTGRRVKRFRAYAQDGVNLHGEDGMFLTTGSGGQTQIGLDSSAVFIGHVTTGGSANARLETTGQISRSTSSLRYKADVEDAEVDADAVLAMRPRTWVAKEDEGDPDAQRFVGFIAEELDALGLSQFVEYDDEGRPDAITYDRLSVGLLAVAKAQQAQLDDLSARLEALEAKP